jgi:hypothetical protein
MITGVTAILVFSIALVGFGGIMGYFYGAVQANKLHAADLNKLHAEYQAQVTQIVNQYQTALGGGYSQPVPPGTPMMYFDPPSRPIGFRKDNN